MKDPLVSIIVPNYNHELFLPSRLDSIFNQTFQNFEVILLDDCSTDNSLEILKEYASHPKVTHFKKNNENSGSPFRQWKKGIGLAKGEFIWIAESDDYSSTSFLETLLKYRKDAPVDPGIIYTQSLDVDEKGRTLLNRLESTSNFYPNIWKENFLIPGLEYLCKYLKNKNVIPNASAVIFKKSLIDESVINEELLKMKMCGDWLFWIKLASKTSVGFVAEPHNFFRTHPGVSRLHTNTEKKVQRLAEEAEIRRYIKKIPKLNQKGEVRSLYFAWQNLFGLKALVKGKFYDVIIEKHHYPSFIKNFVKKRSMPVKPLNIALLSPSKNAYSETFIQAHKERLKGKVFFYYSGEIPTELEGGIVINSRSKRIIDIIKGHFRLNKFSLAEQAVMTSFKKNKINIVFAEFGPSGEKIVPVCQELGLPLIVHFHGYDASRYEVLKENDRYRQLFNYASYIIVVSKKMFKDLLNLGCKEVKLVYNPYGPREDFLQVKPKFTKPQFIAIGRFTDKKAPYYLILAFKEVVMAHPNTQLFLAGDGELLNSCKNLAKHFNLERKVIFPGVISKEKYISYLEESVAMVQHSITADDGDTEGAPLSILEASAAGLPVLSTRHAGIPDVIEDGVTGLLVEEHDVKGMAQQMKRILEESELKIKLGENGKRNIGENFTIERHIKILNELVEKVVNK